jgi:hypothetical protein
VGQTQDVARLDAVHEERYAQSVTLGEEVRAIIDVCSDVVRTLGAEYGQQFANRIAQGRRRLCWCG